MNTVQGINANCECEGPGECARHGITKTPRQFELCRGIDCTAQQCTRYWDAWEQGRLFGQTAPVADPKPAALEVTPRKVIGLGDWVSRQIQRVTGVKACGGCKGRAATLNHWFPADLPPIEPITLDSPTRHLMFHIWPVKGYGGWQWNCDRLLANAALFNGRRIVSIVLSRETDRAEAVQEYLRGFTDEYIVMPNNPKLREVQTFIPMLERLEGNQGPQEVTFTAHSKCVRHRIDPDQAGSTIFRWAEAMWETVLHWPAARPLLEHFGTVGSFRRFGKPQSGAFGPWHYSGTFYWFRNRDAFARNWRYVPKRFFGTEAWPGWMFRPEESGCIVCDRVNDLYNLEYWEREIEPQLAAWREARREGRLG